MSDILLEKALNDYGVAEYVKQSGESTLLRMISPALTSETSQKDPEKLPRIGFVYECQGIAEYQNWITNRSEENLQKVREIFLNAFDCWRAITSLPSDLLVMQYRNTISHIGTYLLQDEFVGEPITAELTLAFHLGVSGLLAGKTAETRLELQRFLLPLVDSSKNWRDKVSNFVFTSFVLLIRKANGWDDINKALDTVNILRRLQKEYEDAYLDDQGDEHEQALSAIELVGLYNLAQMITLVGDYLREGTGSPTQINNRLDRHHERALESFSLLQQPVLSHMTDLLWIGCHELIQNSIWTHVASLGEGAQKFARSLTKEGRLHPVIELWPSQQLA